jgi:tetratricopeptide (TPR) repeat protein
MIRLAAAVLVLGALATAPARAEDVAEAKARFKKGVELYRDRRWRDAMAEFEAAYRAKPHGAIQFNIAQCRERLEDWPGALRSYQDYLREVPDATDRAAVRASMRRLEERLAAAGAQLLLVYTDPPGARLSIDGKERGNTPLHAVLAPGRYALVVTLDGHETVKDQIELSASASRVVDVVLRTIPRTPATAAAPDLTPRPHAVAPPVAPVAPVAPAPAPPRPRKHLATWIAAGTAIVAVATGAVLGWSARQDASAIDAMSAPDRAAASQRARDAQAKARAANVLYALGGGAAAVGGTLFVLEARF